MRSIPSADIRNGSPLNERRRDLLDRKQAAAYLGMSPSFLTHKLPEDGGPAQVRMGKRVFYRIADLDHYIDHVVRQETQACPSTVALPMDLGGTASTSQAANTAGRPARTIAEELRKRSAGSAPRSKQARLPVVGSGSGSPTSAAST
jgi:hypothetical protein